MAIIAEIQKGLQKLREDGVNNPVEYMKQELLSFSWNKNTTLEEFLKSIEAYKEIPF